MIIDNQYADAGGIEKSANSTRLSEKRSSGYTGFPSFRESSLRLMLLDLALACPSVSQKSTQCRRAAVPMAFPDHPQSSHFIAKNCASVCSRFRAPLALAVATGAPQPPHWKRNTCTKGSSAPCNIILPPAGLEHPDRPTLAAAVSEIHTSNGRIPLTKDPRENGYKPLSRRG